MKFGLSAKRNHTESILSFIWKMRKKRLSVSIEQQNEMKQYKAEQWTEQKKIFFFLFYLNSTQKIRTHFKCAPIQQNTRQKLLRTSFKGTS